MSGVTVKDQLLNNIKTLSETLWENRATLPVVEQWLSNFTGDTDDVERERLHALHLLANLNYFGLREIRELLKVVYRDLYRYPIIQDLRASMGPTANATILTQAFEQELKATRFLGMGNPSESGTHLLYYFRQENTLPKDLFVHPNELFTGATTEAATRLIKPLKHIVFIDDLLGSGTQAAQYSDRVLKDISAIAARDHRTIRVHYLVLFARSDGLSNARATAFDRVATVHELDDSYRVFHPNSRVFRNPPSGVDSVSAHLLAKHYGSRLAPGHPLGYKDGQLLLGFHYNIPDNTLPIVWSSRDANPSWTPVMLRYDKVY